MASSHPLTHDPTLHGRPQPRTAVISGATGGLGPVLARHFEDQGCQLLLPVRGDTSEAQAAFPDATVVQADLTVPEEARHVASVAQETWGTTDAVVNVAGGFAAGSALTLEPATLERQLDLNLRTAVNLTTTFLPSLVKAGRGAIVGISASAARGASNVSAYAASKQRSRRTCDRCTPRCKRTALRSPS